MWASPDGLPGPEPWDSTGLGVSRLGPNGLSCRTRSSCLELKEVSLFSGWGMAPAEGTVTDFVKGKKTKTFLQETLILCVVLQGDTMAVFGKGSLHEVSYSLN